MFLKFCSSTHGLFEELGRHAKGCGSQECPNRGACEESVEQVLFKCACIICFPFRTNFWDCLKKVLPPDAFEAFLRGSIFDEPALRLGEKQGVLVNDECSSQYNRVGDF